MSKFVMFPVSMFFLSVNEDAMGEGGGGRGGGDGGAGGRGPCQSSVDCGNTKRPNMH